MHGADRREPARSFVSSLQRYRAGVVISTSSSARSVVHTDTHTLTFAFTTSRRPPSNVSFLIGQTADTLSVAVFTPHFPQSLLI